MKTLKAIFSGTEFALFLAYCGLFEQYDQQQLKAYASNNTTRAKLLEQLERLRTKIALAE
jgi:hypothetical protein